MDSMEVNDFYYEEVLEPIIFWKFVREIQCVKNFSKGSHYLVLLLDTYFNWWVQDLDISKKK